MTKSTEMDIVAVDAGISNIRSVETAFERIGHPVRTITEPDQFNDPDAIILPGVGAFEAAMKALGERGLDKQIKEKASSGTPVLGVCLGMQLYSDVSEEFGTHQGLGLIPGRIVRLNPREEGVRVPNIGWHGVRPVANSTLFGEDEETFYHVHSYHFRCEDQKDVAATIDYGGETVVVAVQRGNMFGVQFHPEKSQDAGLDLLARFCELAQRHMSERG